MQLSASTFPARKSIDESVTLSSDCDVDQMKSSSVVVDVQKLVVAGSLQEDIGITVRLAVSALFSMTCLTSLEQHCSC